MQVWSAYNYDRKTNLVTGDSQYCPRHQFTNESVLQKEAVVVSFENPQVAMDYINEQKANKQ
jgi:hypothetical protein